MIHFNPNYYKEEARIWAKRFNYWSNKIIENKEIADKYSLKIDAHPYFSSKIVSFWIYFPPYNVSDKKRKEVGRWIMELIGTKIQPREVKINSIEDRCFKFEKVIKDDFGKYEIEFNLVI